MTKFGVDQLSSPPPLWWRRLERSLIIVVAPALSAFMATAITDPRTEELAMSGIIFGTAIIKGIGMFLGTDIDYDEIENYHDVP